LSESSPLFSTVCVFSAAAPLPPPPTATALRAAHVAQT
jgi:hypothetical protein